MPRSEPLFIVHASSGVPIYRQLVEQVEALVAGGRLRPGDVVPSVRQVAAALGINPMTVSKAWSRLEADGVLTRDRGSAPVWIQRAAGRDGIHAVPEQVIFVVVDTAPHFQHGSSGRSNVDGSMPCSRA
jgi:DNA-binding transcriptional regulator YhcF (GntR family)